MTAIDWFILTGYFLISALIGIAATFAVRNREDYLMGGRRFGKIFMIFFSFGAGTHADSAVGVAAQSYRYGLAGIWYQWVMLFTLPIYWIIAPIFRRARVQTTADFYEQRYGTGFMYFYAFFSMFICLAYTSVMLYGSARLIESLTSQAISWQWAILLMGVISFAYGTLGGLVAAVWNDLFQGILTIIMSLMIIPFFWGHIGGLTGFRTSLPDASETFQLVLQEDVTIFWIVMMALNSLISAVAQPQTMASIGAAKTEFDSRIGFVGGLLLKRFMTIPWALTGVMAIAMFGADAIEPDHAFGAIARDLLPSGFLGLMLACVMASVMDNCAIMMVTFSGIFTNSIYVRCLESKDSESRLVYVSRVTSLIFAIVCIGMSYAFDDVASAMRFLWKTVPPMGIPFFLGVCFRRTNRFGAFASVLSALAAVSIAEFVFQWSGDAGLPYTIALFLTVGIISGILVSLASPPEPGNQTDAFFLRLRTPVGHEDALRRAGLIQNSGSETFELPEDGKMTLSDSPSAQELQAIASARRQSILGFIVLVVIILLMLWGVNVLAAWFSGGIS